MCNFVLLIAINGNHVSISMKKTLWKHLCKALVAQMGKKSACNAGDSGSIPGSGRQLGEFHGQRSLVRYSPWECKQSDMTELLIFFFHAHTVIIRSYLRKIKLCFISYLGKVWFLLNYISLNTEVCLGFFFRSSSLYREIQR